MKNYIAGLLIFFAGTAISQPLWMRYPTLSPQGDKIAFCYQGDIFVVDAKGGVANQITSHSAHDYKPVWNNDGTMIAFASNRYGNFDIYLVSVDGGAPTR